MDRCIYLDIWKAEKYGEQIIKILQETVLKNEK